MSCSPAELISVSIEQFKFQFNQLYLQTVEKSNHLPNLYLFAKGDLKPSEVDYMDINKTEGDMALLKYNLKEKQFELRLFNNKSWNATTCYIFK
jgi:hypothetical protein